MTSLTKVILLKELRETLRDKRVVLGVIVSPLLLTPCLMAAIFFFAGKKTVDLQTSTLEIGIVQESAFPELTEHIESDDSLKLTHYDSRDEALAALESLDTRAVIVIPHEARIVFQSNGSAPIELLYSSANENSSNARNRLSAVLDDFNQRQTRRRLEVAHLDPTFIQPIEVESVSIAESEAVLGLALSMFLPYLVVMSAAFGGINTAFDLCAGEKERGTMETLLVSPASRYDIVKGKLYTIFTISVISSICSILGIVIAMAFGGRIVESIVGEELSFSYINLFGLVLIVIPLSLLSSAALLFVSSFARNPKEAQAYIFPFIAIFLFPAVLSSILGAESPLYTAYIPVLNIALSMKQLLGGIFDLTFFCISFGSSLAYAFISMRAVAALFQRETILFRS